MFKFNFNVEEETTSAKSEGENDKNAKVSNETDVLPLPAELIVPEIFKKPTLDDTNPSFSTFTSEGMEVITLNTIEEFSDKEHNHTDLLPGLYEGGFKIWECTKDLADFLFLNHQKDFEGKTVLDLGCGAGILGIIALKLGAAKCHFQDYNKDVLQNFTIPNVQQNFRVDERVSIDKCQFYSGDWENYTETTVDTFDIILTSETIYNPENNNKLIDLFMKKLKSGGMVLLAAKTYYFGVGGGLRNFEENLADKMRAIVVWKNNEGVAREIIKIEHIV